MKIAIIAHGGSGRWPASETPKALELLDEATELGLELLKTGGSSRDAVENAINHLEDSGYFNAGRGSIVQMDGKIRMDAAIMDSRLNCGAVGAIEDIQRPISVARKVMENTDHVLLVSKYATDFAVKNGFERVKFKPRYAYKNNKMIHLETVGSIAIDKKGIITVGASTGGRSGMLPGRVGDTAIIGAGVYANEFAGATSTGVGESFIKTTAVRKAVDFVEAGLSPQEAAKKCIRILGEKTGHTGGMIVLDKKGNYGAFHSSKDMPFSYKSA